jgi:hypothetical protein
VGVVVAEIQTAKTQIVEKGKEPIRGHFANQLRFAQRRPRWFLKHNEEEALLFEYLKHTGSEGCPFHEQQIVVVKEIVPSGCLPYPLQ